MITKLTKKQEASMKEYAQKWIEIGLKTGDADFETFDKYMPICYEKAKIIYPKNIVRVQSPLVGALSAAVAEAIWKKKRGAVDGAVGDAVDGAVRGAVRDAVDGAVRGAVGDAVRDAVGDAVGGAVDGAVRGAVDGAVDGAVRDAVRGAVDGAVRGAVRDAVDGAVGGAVRGAVDGAVRDAVDGAVGDAVRDAVRDAVSTAISIAKKTGVIFSWHYWLPGQFGVGWWYYYGVAFVNFFFDICKLKLSKDIMDRALAYRKVCESVNYIWPNSDFIIVCDRPKHILRDENGRLHSRTEKAIEYKDSWGLYMIHGVKFTQEQFEKVKTATVAEIIGWDDIDQRSVLLRDTPIEKLLETVPKKLIDHSEECGGYDLWEIELEKIGKAKIIAYSGWSSNKKYVKFVPLDSVKALDTVAALRHQTTQELINSSKS